MSKTVVVGCKLPNGLIIELNGKQAKINGKNTSKIIGGHGITENVDAELFNAWLKVNVNREIVKNGFIFAHESKEDTKANAKEKAKTKTGLEPINPSDKAHGVEQAKD